MSKKMTVEPVLQLGGFIGGAHRTCGTLRKGQHGVS